MDMHVNSGRGANDANTFAAARGAYDAEHVCGGPWGV